MIIKKFNRGQNKKSVRTEYWCGGCDANLIGPDEKCRVCGHRDREKRYKKSVDIDL